MPTLAIFDGISILMYLNDHAPPHFHVNRAGKKAAIEIESGRVMRSNLDRRTLAKVQAWRMINQSALSMSWTQCQQRTTMTK